MQTRFGNRRFFLGLFSLALGFNMGISAPEKISLAVLYTEFPEQDSLARENWSKELGQSLASDTQFLVYDLRTLHAVAFDKVFSQGFSLGQQLPVRIQGNDIHYGLAVFCRMEEDFLEAATMIFHLGAYDLQKSLLKRTDSVFYSADILRRPASLKLYLLSRFKSMLTGKSQEDKVYQPSLKMVVGAKNSKLFKKDRMDGRGFLDSIPMGYTLKTGPKSELAVAMLQGYYLIFYPNSSYTYAFSGILCLNQGSLGVVEIKDSTVKWDAQKGAVEEESKQVVWNTVAHLASLDSSNSLWRAFGKISNFDSASELVEQIRQLSALEIGNPMLETLKNLSSLDSGVVMLKSLSRMAALDSTNPIWKKIFKGTNSHEELMVLTPSGVLKGNPKSLWVQHLGSLTRVELIEGALTLSPLLSALQPMELGSLEWGETHGFSSEKGRLSVRRGDKIRTQWIEVLPKKGGSILTVLLSGKLFDQGRAVPTPSLAVQKHFQFVFAENDVRSDLLIQKPPTGRGSEKGSDASGCYLCRPNRLGP